MRHHRYSITVEHLTLGYHVVKRKENGVKHYDLIITEHCNNTRRTFTLLHIASSRRDAHLVARFFCENSVTPEHAEEIFEEYFGYLLFSR